MRFVLRSVHDLPENSTLLKNVPAKPPASSFQTRVVEKYRRLAYNTIMRWLYTIGVLLACLAGCASVGPASKEWAAFQQPGTSTSSKRPTPTHAIARVSRLVGTSAVRHPAQHKRQSLPLTQGVELFVGDEIETHAGTLVELTAMPDGVFPTAPITATVVRLGEATRGSFAFAPYPGRSEDQLSFRLQQGTVLVNAHPVLSVSTRQALCLFSDSGALVKASAQGTSVGVFRNVVTVRTANPNNPWNVILVPGEQLHPSDIGTHALHLTPAVVEQMLSFTNLNALETLPYPLNHPMPSPHTWRLGEWAASEPLLTQFDSFVERDLKVIERWKELQNNRWKQYVYERNQQRRDRLAHRNLPTD